MKNTENTEKKTTNGTEPSTPENVVLRWIEKHPVVLAFLTTFVCGALGFFVSSKVNTVKVASIEKAVESLSDDMKSVTSGMLDRITNDDLEESEKRQQQQLNNVASRIEKSLDDGLSRLDLGVKERFTLADQSGERQMSSLTKHVDEKLTAQADNSAAMFERVFSKLKDLDDDIREIRQRNSVPVSIIQFGRLTDSNMEPRNKDGKVVLEFLVKLHEPIDLQSLISVVAEPLKPLPLAVRAEVHSSGALCRVTLSGDLESQKTVTNAVKDGIDVRITIKTQRGPSVSE